MQRDWRVRRQSYGVEEDSDPRDLTVYKVVDVRRLESERDAGRPPGTASAYERENLVGADRFHTVDVDSEVGSGILDVREISLYAFPAFVNPDDERRAQLDMLAAAGQVPVKVPVVDRSHRAAHDLHVLLRHRLLLQPHGFEGL